ncbi:MAG: hypothetical protein E7048_01955 [Lentisphaerae bacterium]|nr:hypothetical protein [Lentisphaerota bacterium]
MKIFLKLLYRFFTDQHLKLCFCRGILCAAGAIFLWARPAASLKLWASLLPLTAFGAVLMLQDKVPQQMKYFLWLFPVGASCLWFRTFPDSAAFWALACIAFMTAWKRIFSKSFLERITAFAAAAAGTLLLFKSFTAEWFDLVPATLLLLAGSAGAEFTEMFRPRCKKNS